MEQRSKQIHNSIGVYLQLLHLGIMTDTVEFEDGPAAAVCNIYPNLGKLCFLGIWSDYMNHPQRGTYTGEVTNLPLHYPMPHDYYNMSWVLNTILFYEN